MNKKFRITYLTKDMNRRLKYIYYNYFFRNMNLQNNGLDNTRLFTRMKLKLSKFW